MRFLRSFQCLLIFALLLSACNTATPTAQPAAPSPMPQSSPVPVALPIATQSGYPLRPTATLFSTPEAAPGVFTDFNNGVTLQYPLDWTTGPSDRPDTLSWFYSPDGSVYAVLFFEPYSSADDLQTAAKKIEESALSGLQELKIISAGTTQLTDGRDAWSTVATASRTDNSKLKANVTTTIFGSHTFSLLVFGSPSDFDNNTAGFTTLINALQLEQAARYGIPRDQAIFLAGGESRNPREYDPATTHGSGDKLVYSGLVSFDPHLNLVPELAATWEVTNGITYTFRLRPDARFHNGRPVTTQDVIYSWERAADPKTNSDTVLTYLGDIVGVKEMRDGKADHVSGLKAIDDHTLQVVIDQAKPYFLLKLTYP
ncbi:MAG TPA: ABC transporter substrate-binding protein, partial [Anaerolineae bacterium]|nr:ABC transporter substrate-binding protein [Anaerolineae bacterium]